MSVIVSPFGPKPAFQLATGLPAVGNQLFFYVAGSVNTKQNTYTDSTGGSANTNPIVLNALGEPSTEIWFTAGQQYKVVYAPSTDTDPPTSPIWTIDHLSGINDVTVAQDQWVISGLTPTFVSATSFTLVGDQTVAFHAGRRLKTTNSGGTIYSTILSSVFGAVTTLVLANDSGTLDAGLSAVSYGLTSAANTSAPAIGEDKLFQGRLTLTSGTAVTTTDVTAAETVYLTPFRGNAIDLYDNSATRWVRVLFGEISVDVPDATQMNDVFVYLSSGVLTLETVAWTNTTTRATALTTQNGALVKSGSTNKRYVGSFYATTAGNGQTEDSAANRLLFNYYNRVKRFGSASFTANRTTASTSYVEVNTEIRNQFVVGVTEDAVQATVSSFGVSNNTNGDGSATSVGFDGTTAEDTAFSFSNPAAETLNVGASVAPISKFVAVGLHYATLLGRAIAGGTSTWTGGATPGGRTTLQTSLFM